jgi:hypothetical protein
VLRARARNRTPASHFDYDYERHPLRRIEHEHDLIIPSLYWLPLGTAAMRPHIRSYHQRSRRLRPKSVAARERTRNSNRGKTEVRRTGKFRSVSDANGILNYRLAAVVPWVPCAFGTHGAGSQCHGSFSFIILGQRRR